MEFYLILQFQVTVHHHGEVKAETSDNQSQRVHAKAGEKSMQAHLSARVCLSWLPAFTQPRVPYVGDGATHGGLRLPTQINLIKTVSRRYMPAGQCRKCFIEIFLECHHSSLWWQFQFSMIAPEGSPHFPTSLWGPGAWADLASCLLSAFGIQLPPIIYMTLNSFFPGLWLSEVSL